MVQCKECHRWVLSNGRCNDKRLEVEGRVQDISEQS